MRPFGVLYDEVAYLQRVSELSRDFRVAWAAAAAELLLPTAKLLPDVLSEQDVVVMRSELDRVWDSVDRGVPLDSGSSGAEALVPDDEVEHWRFEHGLAQNVAASVAYATWCAHSGDAQRAIWGWRQVGEIVDYVLSVRRDQGLDRSGLPDVTLIIGEYLTLLERQWSITDLREAVLTRAEPLSRALISH